MIGQLLLVHLRYLETDRPKLAWARRPHDACSVQPGAWSSTREYPEPAATQKPDRPDREAAVDSRRSSPSMRGRARVADPRASTKRCRLTGASSRCRPGRSRRAYATIADELVTLDINMDLAPVADLGLYPELQHLGDRAFSPDPDVVARAVVGAVKALQARAIVSVVKHFPGHGRTRGNSHRERSAITATRAELDPRPEPVRAAFAADGRRLMTGTLPIRLSIRPHCRPACRRASCRALRAGVGDSTASSSPSALEIPASRTLRTEADAALAAFAQAADLQCGRQHRRRSTRNLAQALAAVDATLLRHGLVESYSRIMAIKRRFGILTRAP